MNSKVYKCCSVPLCKNTSISTPNKLFVYVPNKKKVRNTWLKLARRDPSDVSTSTSIYFCEDHFDLPTDMENYMEYHIMGSVSQVRMKPECVPTKFECQPGRIPPASEERPYISKKRKVMALEESEKQIKKRTIITEEIASGSGSSQHNFEETQNKSKKLLDKSVQVNILKKIRSKANQTENQTEMVHQATSPMQFEFSRPSSSISDLKKKKKGEQSDSDTSFTPSVTNTESSVSKSTSPIDISSDCSEAIENKKEQEKLKIVECTVKKIEKNPWAYIGVPINLFFLSKLIKEKTNINLNHVLLCLKKIRLNNSFHELGDDFAIDKSYAGKIFVKSIPVLASVLKPFIVKLDHEITKKTLPMAFRHKYNKVSCIIDCMEIEIQKPSKSLNQALSWSEYKKANTVKYLVSCTPNGLVNYISPGYGGRITDTCLVEICDFIKYLEPGMCVMADRGFKHVDVFLRQNGVFLVRPPSVASGTQLSKSEAKETKQIASLRIHVERVIRRLREFNMIKPHACLNLNLVKVLDDVLIIACGLINLQNSLIK